MIRPARRGGLAVIGTLAVLLTAGQTWAIDTVGVQGLPAVSRHLGGRDLAPAALPAALIVLAALLAGWGIRGPIRRVVLGLATLAALVLVAVVFAGIGNRGSAQLTAWWAGAVVSSVTVAIAAFTFAIGPPPVRAAPTETEPNDSPRAVWDAVDAGNDPTVESATVSDPALAQWPQETERPDL